MELEALGAVEIGKDTGCPAGTMPIVIQGEDGTVYVACRSIKTGKYVAPNKVRVAPQSILKNLQETTAVGVKSFSDLDLGGKAVVVGLIILGLAGLWTVGSFVKF